MFSTRGRYALRVMIDLAQHQEEEYVPMKDVAARQGISLKYLEQILPPLKKADMIVGMQGKGGGYRLTKKPEEYLIGDILRLTEKAIAPVACLERDAKECERKGECKTIAFWSGLNDAINNYIDGVTLADFI